MLRNRNSDYNLENSVFSRSSFSRRSLHLTKLFVDSILCQLGELPRATWVDGAIGFADTASWKNLVVTGRSAAKIISTLWQRVPTFHGLVFRDENFKGLAHRKKYREQLYLPGVSRELRFYRPRNKNCLACVLCGFNRSGAAPYDSFIPPCKFSRKSNEPAFSDSESFKVYVHGSRWALPSWIVSSVPCIFPPCFRPLPLQ